MIDVWSLTNISPMQKGYNSDLNIRGRSYHVQTEDWGAQNPFLVSRIFCNGAVIKTVKTPHAEILNTNHAKSPDVIKTALQKQHADVIDKLMAGQLL